MQSLSIFKQYASLKMLLTLGLTCLSEMLVGQIKIKGRITDGDHYLPSVTVILLALDSAFVEGVVTDTTGLFVFDEVASGDYLISASMIGYSKYFTGRISVVNENVYVPEIILAESATRLHEIVVKEEKQLFEQKLDRLVINIKSSITASGNTILEVLQKTPGVIVNRHDNSISITGKSNVRVMINDKFLQAPMDIVIQMLEGMSASNVEKIELITTPPAKYESEGNGGIIHIVTSRNEDLGRGGSVGLTVGARWAETLGGSVNLNYRNRRAAYFFDYSIVRNHNLHILTIDRKTFDQDFARIVSVHNHRENVTIQQNLSAGFEYNFNSNTALSFGITGYSRNWNMSALVDDDNHAAADSTLITNMNIHQSNIWQSATATVGLDKKINSDHKIGVSFDYLYYHNSNPSKYNNNLFHEQGNVNELSKIDLRKKTPIQFLIGKVDYRYAASRSFTVEAGVKAVTSNFDNTVSVQRLVGDVWETDGVFSSDTKLEEKSGAIYISANWLPGTQWQITGGLRYEYTHTSGTTGQGNPFTRKYGYLFPNISFKKSLEDEKDFQLSYSRRITRPTYNDIASYAAFWGANTFTAENTALWPAVSDFIKVGYHVKRWIVSLQYNHVSKEINSLQPEVDPLSNILTFRSQNLKYLKIAGVNNSYTFNPASFWEVQGNLSAQFQLSQTSHLGHNFSLQRYVMNISLINILKLPKGLSIEISGMYQSNSFSGISQYLTSGSLNAGIQKQITKSGTLKLAMDDILYTNNWRVKSYSPENNLDIYFKYDWHNQFVRLSYVWNLGNKKLPSVKLKSGSEEERKRVGN
jgi:hypothetical protein